MFSVIRAAAERERFDATGEGIVWAVIDSGGHPHFQRHKNLVLDPPLRHRDLTFTNLDEGDQELEALVDRFKNGTQVAGLIAGEAKSSTDLILQADQKLIGVDSAEVVASTLDSITGLAPRCKLISLKVLDDNGRGRSSPTIVALRWIREMNEQGSSLRIHGVNLGLAFPYDAEQFACGLSLLCVEVNELVKSGVVVVAAAGNSGFALVRGVAAGRMMSITDPGNAEFAITVGSTHGDAKGHGVSYFSSKGRRRMGA
jgi:hypothetical protein